MLIAGLFFAGMQAGVKALDQIHVFEIVFFRSAVTAFIAIWVLRRQGLPLIGNHQRPLIARSVFGVISMTLFFLTLQRMPLGASVSLRYLSPVFTAIFAVLLLKERVQPVQWILFLIALFGVFILKGFDARLDTFTVILGVAGAVFAGLVYVTIRKIGDTEHPLVIVTYFMSLATVLGAIVMLPFWTTPSLRELTILVALGVAGFAAQYYMTKSLQIEAASKVAPFKYIEVVYSLLIGFVGFGEGYNLLSFLGMALILGSMLLNLLVKSPQADVEAG